MANSVGRGLAFGAIFIADIVAAALYLVAWMFAKAAVAHPQNPGADPEAVARVVLILAIGSLVAAPAGWAMSLKWPKIGLSLALVPLLLLALAFGYTAIAGQFSHV